MTNTTLKIKYFDVALEAAAAGLVDDEQTINLNSDTKKVPMLIEYMGCECECTIDGKPATRSDLAAVLADFRDELITREIVQQLILAGLSNEEIMEDEDVSVEFIEALRSAI